MSDSSPSQRDPRIPLDASFVCAYTMWTCGGHVLPFDEACFFRRNEDCDELWIASAGIEDDSIEQWVAGESLPLPADLPEGVSVELACREAVEGGDTVSAASRLLERCLSRRIPFGWPENFIAGGILDRALWEAVVDRLRRDAQAKAEQAQRIRTEIVLVAQELGFSPVPTGKTADTLSVPCPGYSHPMFIEAARNRFCCPWCKQTGGPEELREFVAERKKSRTV